MSFRACAIGALALGLLSVAGGAGADAGQPLLLLEPYPSLSQTDASYDRRLDGAKYCAPVAVANSLLWLSERGRIDLGELDDPKKLIDTLASRRYMNTRSQHGAETHQVMQGIDDFMRAHGHPDVRLQFHGWEQLRRHFEGPIRVPDLDLARTALAKPDAAVWLLLGAYDFDAERDRYLRRGGHWVNLVGYGVGREGEADPEVLVVHDPAPGSLQRAEYYRPVPIAAGTLDGRSGGLPTSAKGFHILQPVESDRKQAGATVLDGVLMMDLE